MFEIAYQIISKSGQIVTRRKEFKTEAARDRFVQKLVEKDDFYQILAYAN